MTPTDEAKRAWDALMKKESEREPSDNRERVEAERREGLARLEQIWTPRK